MVSFLLVFTIGAPCILGLQQQQFRGGAVFREAVNIEDLLGEASEPSLRKKDKVTERVWKDVPHIEDKEILSHLPSLLHGGSYARETETRVRLAKLRELMDYLISPGCMKTQRHRIALFKCGYGCALHAAAGLATYAIRYGHCIELSDSSIFGPTHAMFKRWKKNSGNHSESSADAEHPNKSANSSMAVSLQETMTDLETEPVSCIEQGAKFGRMLSNYDAEMLHGSSRLLYGKLYACSPQGDWNGAFAGLDSFARTAEIMAYLFEPTDGVLQQVRTRTVELGFPRDRPVIGLHVRLGDACSDNMAPERKLMCEPLVDYMPLVNDIAERYGIKDVYLTTDSTQAVADTEKFPMYNWIMDKKQRRMSGGYGGKRIEDAIVQGEEDGNRVGKAALLDILLLSQADALVGKLGSNFGRAALEIHAAKRRILSPFQSLDSSWCFATHWTPNNKYWSSRIRAAKERDPELAKRISTTPPHFACM
mmetsp:Transcript_26367/g.51108  ORF Transcript_26367/g.51108 Transcript_26367/m.51108 type:complete len:479 (-) Transcript_26367:44-1480(-)